MVKDEEYRVHWIIVHYFPLTIDFVKNSVILWNISSYSAVITFDFFSLEIFSLEISKK